MNKILMLGYLLLAVNSYSQTIEEEKYLEQAEASINDDVYGTFIKEVVKFRVSEDNLNEIYYNNLFIEKIGSAENSRETCSLNSKDFEKWAAKNLNKTKFSSVKEAIDTFSNYNKFSKLNEKKKAEINLKLNQYKQKYGLLIDQEFRRNLAKAEMNAFNNRFKNS